MKNFEEKIDKKLLFKSGLYTLLIIFILFFIIDYSLQIKINEPKKEINEPKKEKIKSNNNKTSEIKEQKEIFYKVKKGDSLYKIANKYNMIIPELKLMNKLEKNNLSIGQILKVRKNGLNMENF